MFYYLNGEKTDVDNIIISIKIRKVIRKNENDPCDEKKSSHIILHRKSTIGSDETQKKERN